MATPLGAVRFEAGGKSHQMQFTTNRLCMLEEKAGLTSLEVATELALGKSQPLGCSKKTLRALFWAGVGDGSITLAQAGDLVDAIGHRRAIEIATDAFDAAHPDLAEDDGKVGDRPLDAVAG